MLICMTVTLFEIAKFENVLVVLKLRCTGILSDGMVNERDHIGVVCDPLVSEMMSVRMETARLAVELDRVEQQAMPAGNQVMVRKPAVPRV